MGAVILIGLIAAVAAVVAVIIAVVVVVGGGGDDDDVSGGIDSDGDSLGYWIFRKLRVTMTRRKRERE